jgi:exo-1,4-beta-D-glucosaminidase
MSKIIPDLVWDNKLPFPLNNTWGYHDAATGNGRYDLYYKEMVRRYGEPVSMESFCNKMQLMNAVGYQGIFEAAGHKLNDIGGVMLWKINAAFPSLVWQVYDWFLMPNAGYYFMQNACEPIHIQLNPSDFKVLALNRTYNKANNITARIELYGLDSRLLFHEEKNIGLSASDVKEVTSLSAVLSEAKGVNFVVLNLYDNKGRAISHNVYWLSKDGDYKPMNLMNKTSVEAKVLSFEKSKSEKRWTIQVTNSSDKIAFFIRPQLLLDGEEVLPTFWTASYFTLAPSETASVSVSCPIIKLIGKNPEIKISGWNVEDRQLILK